MRRYLWLVLIACVSCTTVSDDDNDELVADAGALASCPSAPPPPGEMCGDEVDVGAECIYSQCDSSGIVTAATCSSAGTPPLWEVTTQTCDCNGSSCTGDTVCAATIGGAYLVDCRPHTCGDGPLSCDCMCGPDMRCEVGDSVGGTEAQFSCFIDCDPDPCP